MSSILVNRHLSESLHVPSIKDNLDKTKKYEAFEGILADAVQRVEMCLMAQNDGFRELFLNLRQPLAAIPAQQPLDLLDVILVDVSQIGKFFPSHL